jgi:type II secretory ATPase GspE/PulE/Tfp pilus assembly ATPase PilB-like protein
MANNSGLTMEEFFNKLFYDATSEGASDIHIDPVSNFARIRFRIDGKLQERAEVQLEDFETISNKIKVLANLDLTAKQTPQDGQFELEQMPVKIKGDLNKAGASADRRVEVRVSFFPTMRGEAVVMRILNSGNMLMSINDFEMSDFARAKLKKLIMKNYGMLLVTGPAGSGKTSMLYSILQELKSIDKNIITLEDPVEYVFEGLRQSSVRPEQGLTFSVGMKSILRQDPDIIMIGEIRDGETAEHAIRAALLGRLVLSSVHSNSSVGIIARFIDMGIERSLIAYAINGSVAKRLIRKNCQNCKVAYTPERSYLDFFGLKEGSHTFYKGAGCAECHNTGFKGRIGVFEVMEVDEKFRTLIIEKAPMSALEEYFKTSGTQTLQEDALEKTLAGFTTLEEVMSVV